MTTIKTIRACAEWMTQARTTNLDERAEKVINEMSSVFHSNSRLDAANIDYQERDRERERERQTDRQTDRLTYRL